jgi:hypothetical protein
LPIRQINRPISNYLFVEFSSNGRVSRAIAQGCSARKLCTMSATKHRPIRFHSMAENAAPAMFTRRRKAMNRALKAVEDVRRTVDHNGE